MFINTNNWDLFEINKNNVNSKNILFLCDTSFSLLVWNFLINVTVLVCLSATFNDLLSEAKQIYYENVLNNNIIYIDHMNSWKNTVVTSCSKNPLKFLPEVY